MSELGVRMRRRSELICRKCGFDPVLYKKSPELAKLRVQEFFKKYIMDPDVPMIDSPLIELRRKIKNQEKISAKHAYFKAAVVLGSGHAKSGGKTSNQNPRRSPDV